MLESSLWHVGILGMKWGIRKGRSSSPDYEISKKLRKKRVQDLSNKELQEVLTRINLERQYKSANPGKIEKGRRAVAGTVSAIGKMTVAATTVMTAIEVGKKVMDKMAEVKALKAATKVVEKVAKDK